VSNYSIPHFDLEIVSNWEAPVLFFASEILQKGKFQKKSFQKFWRKKSSKKSDFEGFWLLEVRK
jgi:hypothetical protein